MSGSPNLRRHCQAVSSLQEGGFFLSIQHMAQVPLDIPVTGHSTSLSALLGWPHSTLLHSFPLCYDLPETSSMNTFFYDYA